MKNIEFHQADLRIYRPGERPATDTIQIVALPKSEVCIAEPGGGYRTVELAPARKLITRRQRSAQHEQR